MSDIPPEARSPIVGPWATCEEAAIADVPRWAAAVSAWLITSPHFHPAWSQWILAVNQLRDMPNLHPAVLTFEGASHEISIVALNPDKPAAIGDLADPAWKMRYLLPVNINYQFTATDDEMRYVCALMCWSISAGHHTPEPAFSGGPDSDWGRGWLASITKTLAHFRGEVHAP